MTVGCYLALILIAGEWHKAGASIRDDMGEYRVVMAEEVLTELNNGYRMKISCSRPLKRRFL
jgi:hypothetical protein